MGAIINIIVGLIMIVGGLSGRMALIGTNNSLILVGVGFLPLGFGIYRLIRDRRQ